MAREIYLKTGEEIELIRESSMLVSRTLAEIAKIIRPGITTLELDKVAEQFILDHQAKPAFKGYNGFPASLCISINEQVVHGIPGKRTLIEGDLISVDCGVVKNGFYGDSAFSFPVGEVNETKKKLLKITRECLERAVLTAVAGRRLGDIGYEVQEHAESNGFSVVRELVGHGVGRELHEKPEVPNYGKKGSGAVLKEGLVIAIEPMINAGKKGVVEEADKWTIRTMDKQPSAHFEHTVAVREGRADVLSTFDLIDEAFGNR